MKSTRNRTIFLVFLTVLFCTVLPVHAADYTALKNAYIADHPGQSIIPFPWEPTSSVKILPFNYIVPAGPDNDLSITACRGEFEPASFIISSQKALSGITITVPTLYSAQGNSIPSTATDVRLVKVWYQATDRDDIWLDHIQKTLKPELLIKDDSLVRVDYSNQMNYLKVTINGVEQYIDITSPSAALPANAQIHDAQTLQPFSLAANENKQIWLTVQVPESTPAGDYLGNIAISAPNEQPVILNFKVTVLPFDLEPAPLEYAMFYRGIIPADYNDEFSKITINSQFKTAKRYTAEIQDMRDHGVLYPTLYNDFPYWDDSSNPYLIAIKSALTIRKNAGLPMDHIYYQKILTRNPTDSASLATLASTVQRSRTIFAPYGCQDVYAYGIDEASGSTLQSERTAWQTVHQAGGKVFVAGYSDMIDIVGDLLDVPLLASALDPNQADRWHSNGKKIFSYANPQVGVENPELYRRNYGFTLWNAGYDGEMDFAYQFPYSDIWNDFDSVDTHFRDHVFAYPTTDGIIDTIQWEGFREGVDDTRYTATLIRKEGNDASARSIVSGSLSVGNMPAIRKNVINRILQSTSAAPVAGFTGTPVTGTAPLKVIFTDTSANSPTSWLWTFGDGSSVNATARNPVHTYSAPGTYTVSLRATNAVGSDVMTRTGYISVATTGAAPVAGFTATPVTGTAPLKVIFKDASTNSPTSWLWTFGDGSSVNATARNPVHTYSAPGTYTVSLRATNAVGSNVMTRTGYISVTTTGAAPVAGFTATPVTGTAPLKVIFKDTSTNSPKSWNWSFRNASGTGPVVYFGKKNLLSLNQANGAEFGTTSEFQKNRGGETLSSSTQVAWQGSRSVKIVTPGLNANEGMYSSSSAMVIPSTRYAGSVYVRGATGGEIVKLYLEERRADNSHIAYTFSGDIVLTKNWRRLILTSPGNAACRKIVIGLITPERQAATIYADGMQLERGSNATAWTSDAVQNPGYVFTTPGNYTVTLRATNAAGSDIMTRKAYIKVAKAA